MSDRGPLELNEAAVVVLGVLNVLDKLHTGGSVHRDIKPDNVMVREGDYRSPVLIDFGLTFNLISLGRRKLTLEPQQVGNTIPCFLNTVRLARLNGICARI